MVEFVCIPDLALEGKALVCSLSCRIYSAFGKDRICFIIIERNSLFWYPSARASVRISFFNCLYIKVQGSLVFSKRNRKRVSFWVCVIPLLSFYGNRIIEWCNGFFYAAFGYAYCFTASAFSKFKVNAFYAVAVVNYGSLYNLFILLYGLIFCRSRNRKFRTLCVVIQHVFLYSCLSGCVLCSYFNFNSAVWLKSSVCRTLQYGIWPASVVSNLRCLYDFCIWITAYSNYYGVICCEGIGFRYGSAERISVVSYFTKEYVSLVFCKGVYKVQYRLCLIIGEALVCSLFVSGPVRSFYKDCFQSFCRKDCIWSPGYFAVPACRTCRTVCKAFIVSRSLFSVYKLYLYAVYAGISVIPHRTLEKVRLFFGQVRTVRPGGNCYLRLFIIKARLEILFRKAWILVY